MKKHNIVKVVLITLLVFLLLSWIFPAAYYSGQYVDQGRTQMGLFDLFNYPLTALSYFGYISLYIILVGGFYGILYKIPAYRTFLDRIVKSFENKKALFISLVVILFAFAVSICGLQIVLLFFVPLVVSVILLLGYDKMVAAMAIIGSIAVGVAGSTYSYSNANMLLSTLSLKLDYQIGVRFVILIVGIALVIFNTLMYSKQSGKLKVEKVALNKKEDEEEIVVEEVKPTTKSSNSTSKTSSNKTTSKKSGNNSKSSSKKSTKSSKSHKSDNKAALKDGDYIVAKGNDTNDYLIPGSVDKDHKIWPFVVGFTLMFILLVLSFLTWGENGLKITLFDDITKAVTEYKLFGFPLFGKLLGTINSFGNWTLGDLTFPIMLYVILLAIIYKVSLDDVFDGFAEGVKKSLAPAFVAILIYSGLVIVTYHPFQLVLYKAILGWTKGFNIITTCIVAILSSIFNSDIAYSVQSVMPYYITVVTKTAKYPFVALIYQSMYGFTMLFAPTGLVLMSVLSYLGIGYGQWLKNVWKLLLELFIVLLIIFIILAAM